MSRSLRVFCPLSCGWFHDESATENALPHGFIRNISDPKLFQKILREGDEGRALEAVDEHMAKSHPTERWRTSPPA